MSEPRRDGRQPRRLSYANVMATIAVFVVLGGGAWAAQKIGTQDLKNSSVTSAKIKNKTVAGKDLKPSARPFPATLPRGVTLRGSFIAGATADAQNEEAYDSISFGHALGSAPSVSFVPAGGPATAKCPGTDENPRAQPGALCYYISGSQNAQPPDACAPEQYPSCGLGLFGASKTGSGVRTHSSAAGDFDLMGTWAVTAP